MGVADVDICNLALSHVGVSTEIQDLDAERSKEAQACRRFFASTREEVLRAFPWPFATRIVGLQLVEEDPNVEWGFSYRYPSACLAARRVLSGARVEAAAQRIPFRIASDDDGRLILCDLEDAQLEYTADITAAAVFDIDFVNAVALLLASKIGPRFGPEATKLGNRALQLYAGAIARAQRAALDEQQDDLPPDAELISARD